MSGIALQHFSAVMQLANASLSQFFLFFFADMVGYFAVQFSCCRYHYWPVNEFNNNNESRMPWCPFLRCGRCVSSSWSFCLDWTVRYQTNLSEWMNVWMNGWKPYPFSSQCFLPVCRPGVSHDVTCRSVPDLPAKGCKRELVLLAICSTCCLLGFSLVAEVCTVPVGKIL